MELQIRDHLVLVGDINEITEFRAVFGSRPKESSECAEGDINKIIEVGWFQKMQTQKIRMRTIERFFSNEANTSWQ